MYSTGWAAGQWPPLQCDDHYTYNRLNCSQSTSTLSGARSRNQKIKNQEISSTTLLRQKLRSTPKMGEIKKGWHLFYPILTCQKKFLNTKEWNMIGCKISLIFENCRIILGMKSPAKAWLVFSIQLISFCEKMLLGWDFWGNCCSEGGGGRGGGWLWGEASTLDSVDPPASNCFTLDSPRPQNVSGFCFTFTPPSCHKVKTPQSYLGLPTGGRQKD